MLERCALEEKGKFPNLRYIYPGARSPFFIRLFLRGPAMDRALGSPGAARKLAEEFIPRRGPLVAPQQVHGTRIVSAETSHALPLRPRGDGVLLEDSGIEGSLRFADCFPVILASLIPSPWIAILHSGYKGALENIAGFACNDLFSLPGRSPLHTFAWIGPGIGRKHYNRKKEDPWTQKGMNIFAPDCREERGDEIFFDIGAQILNQLLATGLPPGNISRVSLCTFERNDLFYSYRNGDRENRLFLLAFLTE